MGGRSKKLFLARAVSNRGPHPAIELQMQNLHIGEITRDIHDN